MWWEICYCATWHELSIWYHSSLGVITSKIMPLIGGLCHVQRTLTTMGFHELPLVRGLCHVQRTSTIMGLKKSAPHRRCGASVVGGSKSNVFNPSLGLFLYHILHTMSLWRHESIRNNTNNQQTPPPWWWSRSHLQQGGFDDTMQPEGRAALRMFTPRPLLKDFVWFVESM